jgi:FkbM family methyltransferase
MTDASEYQRRIRSSNGGSWCDFEGLVRDIYVKLLQPGQVALDVGVNRGDHFLQLVQHVGAEGFVIGVEAAPAMVDLTNHFLTQSGLAALRNCVLHRVAVSDHEGTAKLHFVSNQPGLSSLADREVARGYEVEVVECPVTTLDKLLADVDRRIDFAKMDIEGAEYHALLGGARLLQQDRCPLVFEFDRTSPELFQFRTEDLLKLFADAGYEIQDFFGFKYRTAEDLHASELWNYFAAPSESIDAHDVPGIVTESLRRQGWTVPAA